MAKLPTKNLVSNGRVFWKAAKTSIFLLSHTLDPCICTCQKVEMASVGSLICKVEFDHAFFRNIMPTTLFVTMRTKNTPLFVGAASLLLVLAVFAPQVFANEEIKSLRSSNGQNIYTVGKSLDIKDNTPDDLFIAAQFIAVNGNVGGDIMAAGQTVDILSDEVAGDVRLAGQSLSVSSKVRDQLIAFGNTVILRSTAAIGGDAWIVGQDVEIRSPIAGSVKLTGETIRIDAPIAGNAEINANSVIFTDNGSIQGNLALTASANVAREKIGGELIFHQTESTTYAKQTFQDRLIELLSGASMYMFLFTLLLGAALIYLMLPFWIAFADSARTFPFVNFGLGFLALIVMPIVAILLFITLIGFPIGFIVLFAYIALLIFVGIIDGLALGALFFPITKKTNFNQLLASFAVGSTILYLLCLIPVLGWFIKFIIFVLALGTLMHVKYELLLVLRKAKRI